MIYAIIILLVIGIWQEFKNGSLSRVISAICLSSTFLLFVIAIIVGKIALQTGLLIVFILSTFFILFRSSIYQRFIDKTRVKQCLEYYKNKKEENPDLTEDEICRLLLTNWIYRTSSMKNVGQIEKYINELFKNKISLLDACIFGIQMEFKDRYGIPSDLNKFDFNEHTKNINELKIRINRILNQK